MRSKPLINHPIPTFQMQDYRGEIISSDRVLGHSYVLYFYPKNDTPGCTKQACDLRDTKKEFEQLKIHVIGVSPDTATSQDQFIAKYALNFNLIPDPTHALAKLFEVWEEKTIEGKIKGVITRTTFVVDDQGIIRWIEKPVQVEGHAQRVLQAVKTLDLS